MALTMDSRVGPFLRVGLAKLFTTPSEPTHWASFMKVLRLDQIKGRIIFSAFSRFSSKDTIQVSWELNCLIYQWPTRSNFRLSNNNLHFCSRWMSLFCSRKKLVEWDVLLLGLFAGCHNTKKLQSLKLTCLVRLT
ncbi:uncharacterized protein LOC131062756 [Cryptomeria japonica]|uniref:uncharacterized protein LOC131062756 n=1 Tax=Cryptomeria japonica TaxID=3369 RepID=UPI0027DA5E1C|nr:uncharacterized protein LOC131062756 [Cryptomeria japonica]